MDEVVSHKKPLAQYKDQKLFLRVYSSEGNDNNPQCRAEIPPMSKDERYAETFCKPVQDLRQSLGSI